MSLAASQLVMMGLQVAVVAGLLVRGRTGRARLLGPYLGVNLLVQGCQLSWPATFHRWSIWTTKELLLTLLAAAVVVEITWRVFARLPRAGLAAWVALTVVATATVGLVAVGVGGAVHGHSWLYVAVTEILPRVAFGSAGLCMVTLAVMSWYHVPRDRVHQAVLFGFAFYLAAYAGPIGSAGTSAVARAIMYRVTPTVYVLVLGLWTWAAWSRDDEAGVPLDIVRRVQPWR